MGITMRKKICIILLICLIIGYGRTVTGETSSSVLEIHLPEYSVRSIEGWDYVDIPGGNILFVENKPRVPYYTCTWEYPEKYRIQNVVMIERDELETTTGLNLTTVQAEQGSLPSDTEFSNGGNGWYPEDDYTWETWVNTDGTSTLTITVYPFYYNPETTDVKYYRNYLFEVDYILTNTFITELTTDENVYEATDEVTVNVYLNNTGTPQDIVISLIVKKDGTCETIASLMLRTLKDLSGEASFQVNWDAQTSELGDYYIEASLSDADGNMLDKKTTGFSIYEKEEEESDLWTKIPGFPLEAIFMGLILTGFTLMLLEKKSTPIN